MPRNCSRDHQSSMTVCTALAVLKYKQMASDLFKTAFRNHLKTQDGHEHDSFTLQLHTVSKSFKSTKAFIQIKILNTDTHLK